MSGHFDDVDRVSLADAVRDWEGPALSPWGGGAEPVVTAEDLRPQAQRPPVAAVENGGLTEDDMMQFIVAAVENEGLVGHNITAFNSLIEEGIPQILEELFHVTNVVKDHREQTEMDRQRDSIKIDIRFHNVQVGRPTYATYPIGKIMPLYPNEARLTGRTYAAPLSLAMEVTLTAYYTDGREEVKRAEIPSFQVAHLPIMVGSNRCHTWNLTREARKNLEEDPNESGGYFLAKAGEWVVDWLENISFNQLHTHRRMAPNERVRGEFISQPGGAYENSSQIIVRFMTSGAITIEINSTKFSKTRIPFVLIFRILGMTSDQDVLEQIVYDPAAETPVVRHMTDAIARALQIEDAAYAPVQNELDREKLTEFMAARLSKFVTNPTAYKSNEHAIQYLNDNLLEILDRVLLPHVGRDAASRGPKLRYLGMLMHKIFLVDMGILEPTDRDSYSNKRCHGAGVSYAKALKTQFNNSALTPVLRALKREVRNTAFEELGIPNIADAAKNAMASSDLSRTMDQSITSGNKTIIIRRRAVTNRVSTQALERKNPANVYSALRSVSTSSGSSASKQTERADKMRRVHSTYAGFICIAKSADTGEMVGMKKELAITATVCPAGEPYPLILRLLEDPEVVPAHAVRTPDLIRQNLACVFVNGRWVGCCRSAPALVGRYRALRRESRIVEFQTSIVWNPVTDDVEFLLDVGRLTRPLLIVDNNLEEYDAACRARHAWARAHGGGQPLEGVVIETPGGAPAGVWVAGRYFALGPDTGARWRPGGGIDLADAEALVAAGQAREEPPPANVLAEVARLAARHGVSGGAGAPARVEFAQNIRLTPAHIAQIRAGTLGLEDLRAEGVVEWITPEEAENCLIAPSLAALRAAAHSVTERYTHCDVEQAIFGLTALVSPFGDHTQPARVTYETNQGRQAGGWYCFAAPFRVDKNRFFQYYCEVPLVRTIAYNWLFPNGMNTIVAYMISGGYNQEDSAIVKNAFVQRGGFGGAFYRFERADLEKGEFFGSPDITTTKNLKPNASYEKLVDGFVPPGTVVQKGDVLIGRIAKVQAGGRRGAKTAGPAPADDGFKYVDRSIVYHLPEPAVVVDVFRPRGPNDSVFGLVKLRYHRPLGVGDKMCLTPDHDVLTGRGWVPVADVTLSDKVAALAPGGVLAYETPTELFEYDHDGDLYEIETQAVSQRVTLNHRMYVKRREARVTEYDFELIPAEQVAGKRVRYKRDALNAQAPLGIHVCYGDDGGNPDIEFPVILWARLLGMFIADGWTAKDDQTVFSCKKPRKIAYLTGAAEALGLRYAYWPKGCQFVIYSRQVCEDLRPLNVGAVNKRLPDYVWSMAQDECRTLLDALIEGDGSRNRTQLAYYTSSDGLADDVMRLALHAGWSASKWLHTGTEATTSDGRVIRSTVTSWRVGIVRTKNEPQVNHGHVREQSAQTEQIAPYQGKVYCLTVPSHVFYVRRHGRPSWTGNSSRAGNKSITALLLADSDLPYDENGITPDITINPHSIPSRMTIGQMIETSLGLRCQHDGVITDGTAFRTVSIDEISRELAEVGLRYNGRSRLYNGRTGEHYDAAIFMGPTYHQRLQKFVKDDEYAVGGYGPTDALTGQPLEGKNARGGLRIGEMEAWVLESQGAMMTLTEKMFLDSDGRKQYLCRTCGLPAIYNAHQGFYRCTTCGEGADIATVDSCKASLVFQHEMRAANVKVTLGMRPREFEDG